MGHADRERIMTERRIEVYPDEAGEWRWRRVAANGNTTADSGEGYKNRGECIEMAFGENPGIRTLDILGTDGNVVDTQGLGG